MSLTLLLNESQEKLQRWRENQQLFQSVANPRSYYHSNSVLPYAAKKAYDNLLMEGTVVWGSLVQANTGIFQPGNEDLPALYVFSQEDYFKEFPPHLVEISSRLFALKGTKTGQPLIDETAERITNEYKNSCGYPIPYRLTDGHDVFLSVVFLFRDHLPYGRLTSRIMPLLVNLPHNGLALPLPLNFWTEELIYQVSTGAVQNLEVPHWDLVWQTRSRPELLRPEFGGEVESNPRWITSLPPIQVSEAAYNQICHKLRFHSLLFPKRVFIRREGDTFSMALKPRGNMKANPHIQVREITFYYPPDEFSRKNGVSIEFTDGPFDREFVFRRVTA